MGGKGIAFPERIVAGIYQCMQKHAHSNLEENFPNADFLQQFSVSNDTTVNTFEFKYEFSVDKHIPKYLQHEVGAVKSAHRIISIN